MNTFIRRTLVLILSFAGGIACLSAQNIQVTQSRYFALAHTGIDVEISRFGSFIAIADWTNGNSVSVLDSHWELLWRHRQPYYWGGTLKHPSVLQFSPDESLLVFSGYRTDNDIAVVNPRTGQTYAVLPEHSGTVSSIAMSPDGTRLVTYASHELFLWKRTGQTFDVVYRIAGNAPSISSLSFSPDGKLVSASETADRKRSVTVYEVSNEKILPRLTYIREENNLSRGFTAATFSPDGKWLASGYGNSILFWKVPAHFDRSGQVARLDPVQEIRDIELGSVISLRFSPDSQALFSGYYKDVRAYRLSGNSWRPAATFSPHQGHVNDMSFSQDGTRLAIAGDSETNSLGLWSVQGVGPSPLGDLTSMLGGRVSEGQKQFLDDPVARQILSTIPAAERAARDMFETEDEYAQRMKHAAAQAASALQEATERHFDVTRRNVPGAMYAVSIPLQTRGTYDIDHRTYTFRVMEETATVRLDRDHARDLYRNWRDARVVATRVRTPDGPTYGDFRLKLPTGDFQVAVGFNENPFTGDPLDRYGVHVPSIPIGPDLLLRNLTILGIFPSLYRSYADNPVGNLQLQNIGSSTIRDLAVRFRIPGLADTPTPLSISPSLGVGSVESADIHAVFSPSVLAATEGETVPAQLSIQYTSAGTSYSETVTRPVTVLNRNAIRWDDDRKVAAFMFVNDPALLRFSSQVTGTAQDVTTNVLTRNLLTAIRMFGALHAAGVSYVVDPTSPYASASRDSSALDYVRFPLETLDQKGGDCDDLSVLYNTLLESVGVRTAFITTPGHIFTAFDLEIPEERAKRTFPRTEDLIFRAGSTWMPVETTLIDQGFPKAWQTAAVEWREANTAQTSRFFTTEDAWKAYTPAGYSSPSQVSLPDAKRIAGLYGAQLEAYRNLTLVPREKEMLSRLDRTPSSELENQLGILYAQYGLLARALERFKHAIARDEYLPALINAANVLSMRKEYEAARAYLVRAEKLAPTNAHVLISLAFSYFETGKETDARNTFERARRADPDLTAHFPLFGSDRQTSDRSTASRAARADAAELFSTRWAGDQ